MKKQTISVADKEAMTQAMNWNGIDEYAVKKIGDGTDWEFTFKCEAATLFKIGISYQVNTITHTKA